MVSLFDASQTSAQEFAAQHHLTVSTLKRWLREARHRKGVGSPRKPRVKGAAFQQVSLAHVLGASESWVGEVRMPDGTLLRWSSTTGVTTLRQLLGDLRRPC
jgi:hypothetical protein